MLLRIVTALSPGGETAAAAGLNPAALASVWVRIPPRARIRRRCHNRSKANEWWGAQEAAIPIHVASKPFSAAPSGLQRLRFLSEASQPPGELLRERTRIWRRAWAVVSGLRFCAGCVTDPIQSYVSSSR